MKKDQNKKSFKFWNYLSEFSSKHWILSSIFITGSSWWFSLIINFFGENLHLVKVIEGKRILSIWGILITIIIFIILILNAGINRHRKNFPNEYEHELEQIKKQLVSKTAGFNLLDKILYCFSQICKSKCSTQMKMITELKSKKIEPPIIYSNPCEQFTTILDNLVDCLTFLLSSDGMKFTKNDLYASIAYNFTEENDSIWHWADVKEEKGLSIEELLQPGTTFSHLLNFDKKEGSFVLFNSKEKAYKEQKYVPDDCDIRDKLTKEIVGSIACFKIVLKKSDKRYITAILSISSYGKQFVPYADDENDPAIKAISANINNVIISEFSERIKVELCNYYIQFLRGKWEEDTCNSQHN